MPKSKTEKPSLDEDELTEISDALDELRDADYSTPADADSALDALASVLLKCFFKKDQAAFWGKTPDLHDVIKELDRRFSLGGALTSASAELRDYAQDAYEDEFNEFVISEINLTIEEFYDAFTEFISPFWPE